MITLKDISIRGFAGLPAIDIVPAKSVTLICGPNGAGKTSALEAIRFALSEDFKLRGINLKRDLPRLLTDGAKQGSVSIQAEYAGKVRQVVRAIRDGLWSRNELPEIDHLELVLRADGFSGLDAKERKSALSAITGVKIGGAQVAERLRLERIPDKIIEFVTPMLRTGFDAGASFATNEAAVARGEWKGITGEVYGSNKADNWRPATEAEDFDAEALGELTAEAEEAQAAVSGLDQRIGAAQREAAVAEQRAQALADAKRLPKLRAEADGLRRRCDDARANIDRAAAASKALHCPECEAKLTLDDGRLIPFEDNGPTMTPTQIVEMRNEAAGWATEASQIERRIAEAEAIEAIPISPDVAKLDDLRAERDAAGQRAAELHKRIAELRASHAAAAKMTGAADRAADAHERVLHWVRVADLLGPDGIQAEALRDLLGPLQSAMARHAEAAGFARVSIEPDMTLTLGGRGYAQCSESERWRIDAVTAVAIAEVTGIKLALIDRFDVLQINARRQALQWLMECGCQVILAGTLKAAPELPEGHSAIWMGSS